MDERANEGNLEQSELNAELGKGEEIHRRTEAQLRDMEEQYRSALDNMLEGCQIIGYDWRYLYLNDTALKHGKKTREELIGRTMMEAYPGIETTAMFSAMRECMEQRTSRKMENEFVNVDGSKSWFQLSMQPVPRGVFILSLDITEWKQSEENIFRVNRALRVISECNQILVRADDETTLLDRICRAVIQFGGYRFAWVGLRELNEEKNVRPAAYAGHEDGYLTAVRIIWADSERGRGPVGTAIRTQKTNVCRNIAEDECFEPWRKEALKRGYRSIIALPLSSGDETFGAIAIYSEEPDAFDLAEENLLMELANDLAYGIKALRMNQKKNELEKQLLQSQKMEAVGRLAGGIAHDFNNLLTCIIGYTDILLTDFKDNEHWSDIAEIKKAAERASQLTGQLLSFSRKQVLQPKVVNINALVADMDKLFRRILGEDIELKAFLDPALGMSRIDTSHIDQVIMNLVVNARDAMPRGGTLTLETKNVELDENYTKRHVEVQPGSYVMIAISDTGTGMDEETRNRIFEPFFTTKKDKGTGLGLSVVYGIVKQSKGSIEVYSEVGYGTTFKIYLPRVNEQPAAEVAPQKVIEKISARADTILIIDDEKGVRRILKRMLQPHGYLILEAGDNESARNVALKQQKPIDLLITDVILPGKTSSMETVKYLKSLHPRMRTLFMSGYTENVIVHHGILDPGIAFLPKPFSQDTLAQKVREVLESNY